MATVSRPLLALLAATVLGAVVWMVALRPASGGGAPAASATGSRPSAASATGSRPSAASATGSRPSAASATVASRAHVHRVTHVEIASPAARPHAGRASAPAARPHAGRASAPAAHPHAGRASGPAAVDAALRAGRVVAILFYNPASADDLAVRSELLGLRTPRRVLKLAVPSGQIAAYSAITVSIPITITPTLVIVDARHQATVITGFASAFEIASRIDTALAVRPPHAG